MTHDLITLNAEAPDMFLDEIQDWLAIVQDVPISKSALHENIHDCGITYKKLRKAAAEQNPEEQAAWKMQMQTNWVASQCIMIDESSKDDRTIFRRYGRALTGHRAVIPANFVRGDRYSIVAALGIEGYIAMRIVPGSVDGDEVFDFIVNEVVSPRNYLLFSGAATSDSGPPSRLGEVDSSRVESSRVRHDSERLLSRTQVKLSRLESLESSLVYR
jgi:hypothetical protein